MLVSEPSEIINQWIAANGGGFAAPGCFTALGWYQDGELVGGLTWSHYNGKHCLVNVALSKSRFPIGLLEASLDYSFNKLALRRLTFIIAESNIRSQNMVRHLGATHEATLREADPSGDLHIYSLFPENCKLWSRLNERRRKPAAKP